MTTVTMLSPTASTNYQAGSGVTYKSDANGIISGVPVAVSGSGASPDVVDLIRVGCQVISFGGRNNLTATVDPGVANDSTQDYLPGSFWFNLTTSRVWMAMSVGVGAATWALDGIIPGVGSEPANTQTLFGGGTATFFEEGNVYRQVNGVAGAVFPGSTGADIVVGVFTIPANSFDVANRGCMVIANGIFAANANAKRIKLIFNPATAVLNSAVSGGSLMADTGAVNSNGGAWQVSGNVFKRGAAGSNTQCVTSNGNIAAGTHLGLTPTLDTTAVESGPILIAVTINNTTTATDAGLSWLEVNAMN